MKKLYFSFLLFLTGASFSFGQWALLNPMNASRSSHISASFSNGNILVAGGFDLSSQVKSAEIYDFATASWTNTATDMSQFHSSGTATTLNNDKILVVGGYTGTLNTTECEIYDALADTWSAAASLTTGRSDHSATKLQNGKILIVGGYDGTTNLSSCELYDPTGNTWSNAASLATGRSSHTATLLNDGRILVSGGYNPNAGFQLQSSEIYDPVADSWTSGPSMAFGRNLHAASLLADGNVLISGGESFTGATPFAFEGLASAEIFNSTNNTFSAAQNLPAGLCYHKQISFGNYVMAIAGKEKTDYLGGNFTSLPGKTYLYNALTDTWQEKLLNNEGRIYFTASLGPLNKIVVVGGGSSSVELFDPSLSLASIAADQHFSVFPNPAQTSISLSLNTDQSNAKIRILDLSGRCVFESNSNKSNLDVSKLQNGVYCLEIELNGKLSTEKFVKNN